MAETVTVKVKDGWIVYDGTTQRNGGEMVTTDPDTATEWERAGWVERVPKTRRQRPRQDPKRT
jgi:hypothetical protein